MKTFKYRAMKSDGTKVEGRYECLSRDDVISMITSSGYYPLKIEEIIQSKPIEFKAFDRVTTKDLAVFCRQFYTMLEAGVTIINCIEILSTELPNRKLRGILTTIGEDVKKGELLSVSMSRHKKYFPQLLIKMIESGEISGNIDEMMLRMSIHFEKENKTNNKVKSAMIYPAVLSIVAIVAVIFIMAFVVPTFVGIFEDENMNLPLITKITMGISGFLSNNIILITIVAIIMIIAFSIYKKTPNGIREVSKLKLSFPVIGPLNNKIVVSRFTRTLATLTSSGVSLIHALPTVAGVVDNKIAEESILKILERVVRGDNLSAVIKEDKLLPNMLSSMVKIGEESGSLDNILNKTADFYEDEVEQAVQTATSLIEPILIIFMGLTIGLIVISVMLPMFDMYTQM